MTELTEAPDQTIFHLPSSVAAGDVQHTLLLLDQTRSFPFRLRIGPTPLTIGRVATCNVVLSDATVSRTHCRIDLTGDAVVLTDLNSRNGTFVDGRRVSGPVTLHHGAIVQVASHVLSYERQTQRTLEAAAMLDRDLREASNYVQSLFPSPIHDGPIRAEWLFLPCTELGGCGFGYRWLDEQHFAAYLLGVPGQGISSAMRAVTLMNLLQQPVVDGIDFTDPAGVITGLNARFSEAGSFFSVWYGAYDARSRQLTYASAGHYPAVMIPPDRAASHALRSQQGPIGLITATGATTACVTVDPGSVLCLLSNGAWDSAEKHGGDCTAIVREEFRSGSVSFPMPLRIYQALRIHTGAGDLDDDFCSLVLSFD